MMSLQEKNLSYCLVPAKSIGRQIFTPMQNTLFDFWCSQWEQEFSKNGKPKRGWEDHFLRQDVIAGVLHQDQVIGCHLYTFYNLQSHSTYKSEYFEYINTLTRQKLKMDYTDAMSMEYLCVNEAYQKNSLGVGFGKIVLALGTYVAQEYGAGCVLGMPIFGNKVDKMMENIGAQTIQDNIQKYGYTLKLMAAPTQPRVPSVDPKVLRLCDSLWQHRQDYLSLAKNQKIAA